MNAIDPARPSQTSGPTSELWPELVLLVAAMPDVIDKLRAAHVPDERGRCRACTSPGTGRPNDAWPCTLSTLADAAARVVADNSDDQSGHPNVDCPDRR